MLRSIKVVYAMCIHTLLNKKKLKQYQGVNRRQVYSIAQKMCQDMLNSAGVTVDVRGREHLPQQGPALYVANHKSLFDIVTLVSVIDDPIIFIGKKEVSKMPIVGTWFDSLGCIYIDREDIRQSLKAIMTGIDELKGGCSVIIFPEGTRSSEPDMKTFKEGSFKLATKTQVPIVPIAIQNTYKIFEEKKTIQQANVYVNIGETINLEDLEDEVIKKLPLYVEERVRELLQAITF